MSMYQMSFFEDYRPYIPLVPGIYGKGIKIYPHVPSKNVTPYDKQKYLEHLDPLETYDLCMILYSAGKDCTAATLLLRDLGIPSEKIVLIHHAIDGRGYNPIINMDWKITHSYCMQFAKALGLRIRFSWRELGFGGELMRSGASRPVSFEEIDMDEVNTVYTDSWLQSERLKKEIELVMDNPDDVEKLNNQLNELGHRMKWPALSASLSTRWCSAALKIEVFERMVRYCSSTMSNIKILAIDGCRREESPNRSRYNEMEIHSTNSPKKNRKVHHWRPVIEWTEEAVWEYFIKHRVRPNPIYSLGYNRFSCSACIFGLAKHFKAYKELYPDRFNRLVELEKELDFTIKNGMDINSFTCNAKSCIPKNADQTLINIVQSGIIPDDFIYLKKFEDWKMPAGSFQGAEGGPC